MTMFDTQSSNSFASVYPNPIAITFIDAGLDDVASLVSEFSVNTEVYVLDAGQEAITQITQVLGGRSNISAVNIVSHGSNGALQLGGESISDLSGYDDELQLWGNALTEDADILLYGCNVAENATGQNFVNQLATLTGADVAASTDLTGSAALGGDWVLEYQTGQVETVSLAAFNYSKTLANFTVTSNADSGTGSLREAIVLTNANSEADTISFAASLTGQTITLASQLLLTASDKTTIDGSGRNLTISGNAVTRVFLISGGATAELNSLTIANGQADDGAGVFNSGSLTISNSTIRNNKASSLAGGIGNLGTLTLSNSTFSGNEATFSGGLQNQGTATISNSTFSGNKASSVAGGIGNVGALTISNSILANSTNRDFGANSDTTNNFLGNNLVEDGSRIGANIINQDPNLGPLQNNGGSTATFALLLTLNTQTNKTITLVENAAATPLAITAPTSTNPALNAGDNAQVSSSTDQRGLTRIVGGTVDLGAFELQTLPSLSITVTAIPDAAKGTVFLADGTTAVINGRSLTAAELTGLVFKPAAGVNGSTSFSYSVSDGSSSASQTVSFNITAVNDAPTATGETLSDIAEDSGIRTISFASLLANDSAGSANESGQTLTITNVSNVIGGTASISGSNILFTPTANYNGPASFQYTIQDNGTTNGVNDFKTATATATFNITAVNDAPTATGETLSDIAEDSGTRTISFASLLTNDSAGPANESGQTLMITAVNNVVGGSAVINGTNIEFTPTPNYNGVASFQYTVQDNGTTNGVNDFKTATAIASFNVTAVNDAPVVNLASATQSIANTNSLISGITVSDIDAGNNPVVVTLKVNSGILNVANTSNVTIGSNNTGIVTLTGTIANINTALTNLRYSGINNFSGNDSLNITVNDQGNTGSEGAKSDSKAIALNVSRDLGSLPLPQLISGSVNPTDPVDVYQVTFTSPVTLSATLSVLTGDADLAILDSSGNAIASSNNAGLQAEFLQRALAAGTYRIRVRRFTGSTNYNLLLSKF
jgi:Domain of unknown function (DUF4347)/Bacterial Ig domain